MKRARMAGVGLLALALIAPAGIAKATPAPRSGTWVPTGSMSVGRYFFVSALLANGKVLVAGGSDASRTPLASAELYDPATGTWSVTGSMATPRTMAAAATLPDGKVLVAGGFHDRDGGGEASAEIYNPATGKWKPTGSMNTARGALVGGLVTVDGATMVLVAGGSSICGGCDSLASAELYDPSTGAWSVTGSMLRSRDFWPYFMTSLPDGRAFIVGGDTCCPRGYQWVREAEIYNP